jgi:tight adherence protein C
VADLSQFITAIIQADTLGVSIANVLRIQSDQMRIRRRQRAEELAHKAPIKMLFPMALFIFPAIFVVILGPIVPQISNGLGGK